MHLIKASMLLSVRRNCNCERWQYDNYAQVYTSSYKKYYVQFQRVPGCTRSKLIRVPGWHFTTFLTPLPSDFTSFKLQHVNICQRVWLVGDYEKKEIDILKKLRCYISPLSLEAAASRICTKFYLGAYLPDIIIYWQFYINQWRGFDFVRGGILPFPIGKRDCR